MIDITIGLMEILKSYISVSDLIEDRVYGEELPRDEIKNMPRKNVVIVSAGGFETTKTTPTVNRRFDIWCYGETKYEASKLDLVVYDAVKNIERVSVINMLIHSAGLSGGPIPYTDPETGWSAMIHSINVTADERQIE